MNEKIRRLAYEQGLYSQGTPDSWDEEALENFGRKLIEECIDAIEHADLRFANTTYDNELIEGTVEKCINSIKDRFDI